MTGSTTEQENTLIERIITNLDQADTLARRGDSVGCRREGQGRGGGERPAQPPA